MISAKVETAMQDVIYNIKEDGSPLTLTEPIVIFPEICFTVKTYEVIDVLTGQTPPWVSVEAKDVKISSQ